MGIIHKHFESFFYINVNHLRLLLSGSDTEWSHSHVCGTTDNIRLVQYHNLCSVIRCLNGCCESGRACTYNYYICF